MRTIDLAELHERLDDWIRLVETGERLMVTRGGRPIVELRHPGVALQGEDSGRVELSRLGRLRRGRPNESRLYPIRPVRREAGLAARLVALGRGER